MFDALSMNPADSPEERRIPRIGEVVPDLALPSVDGEIRLERGEAPPITVLTFLEDTIADNALSLVGMIENIKSNLQGTPARFICVLTEPVTTLETFRDAFEITVELASDFDRIATKAFGLLSEKQGAFTSVPRESVFVLDQDLRVTYRWISETIDELPVQEEVEHAIRALMH